MGQLGSLAAIAGGAALGGTGGALLEAGGAISAANQGIGGNQSNTALMLQQYDQILNKALGNAINSSTNYTNEAVGTQQSSLANANNITSNALQNAQTNLFGTTNSAFNLAQGLISPYTNAGYTANDAYLQSLGLATPQGGSQAQANSTAYNQAIGLLNQQYGGTAPTNPTAPVSTPFVDPSNYLNAQQLHDQVAAQAGYNNNKYAQLYPTAQANNNNILTQAQQQYQQQQQQAQQAYQSGQVTYQQYQAQLANLQQIYPQANIQANGQATTPTGQPSTPTSSATSGLSAFLNSPEYQTLFGSSQGQNVANGGQYNPMAGLTQMGVSPPPPANTGTGSFLNSSQYQSLFGQQAGQQFAQNGTYNPVQAFEQNPGTQFAINQGLQSLQQQGAAKGVLNSGSMQNELAAYATGTENQNYNTYLGQIGEANQAYTGDYNTQTANYNAAANAYMGQLGNSFTGYQSNLAGLTNLGSGLTGANTAAQLYGNVANQQNSDIYGTGQQQSNANLSTGSNISGLQANQGVLNANAYLNTGAAQANALMQSSTANAQLQANQQASQAQTLSSLLNNQGYGTAAGMFGYNANQGSSAANYGSQAFANNGGHF